MAMLVQRKEIKDLPDSIAIDITTIGDAELAEIKAKEGYFNEIAWSRGTYGTNGLLLQGEQTKQLYKITNRTSNLYAI